MCPGRLLPSFLLGAPRSWRCRLTKPTEPGTSQLDIVAENAAIIFFFRQNWSISSLCHSNANFFSFLRVTVPKFEKGDASSWPDRNPRTCHAVSTRCASSSSATRLAKYSQGHWKNKVKRPLKLTNKEKPKYSVQISTNVSMAIFKLVYTTQVNSAFRAIWLVPLSRDIKYYSPPGGFRRKKMSRETHFIRK